MSDEPNDEIRSILLLMSSTTLSNLSKISNSFTQEQRNTALDSLFQGNWYNLMPTLKCHLEPSLLTYADKVGTNKSIENHSR